jgi:hypothetical protein
MSAMPAIILEFRKEICDGAELQTGHTIPDERIQQILEESGWTLQELDIDIKEHCLARRTLSADKSKHFYEYLSTTAMPGWVNSDE